MIKVLIRFVVVLMAVACQKDFIYEHVYVEVLVRTILFFIWCLFAFVLLLDRVEFCRKFQAAKAATGPLLC